MSESKRDEVKKKMIELAENKIHESELTAGYYETQISKKNTKQEQANIRVQIDGLHELAKQQQELIDYLENVK